MALIGLNARRGVVARTSTQTRIRKKCLCRCTISCMIQQSIVKKVAFALSSGFGDIHPWQLGFSRVVLYNKGVVIENAGVPRAYRGVAILRDP